MKNFLNTSTVLGSAAVSAIALTTFTTNPINAATFGEMYIFGDSLSDVGNAYNLSGQTFPSNPYYQGRMSNGPLWIEYLAQTLGLNPDPITNPSSGDGLNFALVGATTGNTNTTPPLTWGLEQQLQAYIAPLLQNQQSANPDALYVLWAGANDYLGGGVTDPTLPVSHLSDAVQNLYNVGARKFLVVNLPALGNTPLGSTLSQNEAQGLNSLSNTHNALLAGSLTNLNQFLPELELALFDVGTVFQNAIANPSNYNLTNVTDGCLLVGCTNPENYLFWDTLHPTTAAHKVIANSAYSTLKSQFKPVPEPSSNLALTLVGFGFLFLAIAKTNPTK